MNSLRTAKDLELSLLVKEANIQQLNLKLNDLENRIDKVIEYIKEQIKDGRNTDNLWLMGCYDEDLEILKILKGEDNEI